MNIYPLRKWNRVPPNVTS